MNHLKYLTLLGAMLALAGCSNPAETLGLGRNPPDEFAVVERPPLSLPPDFELKPPRPGAPRPQEISTDNRASQVLFGSDAQGVASAAATDAEKALLTAAGAEKAAPNIRGVVDREATQKVAGSRHLIDDLLGREGSGDVATVDADAEAKRIREAKQKGESVDGSATPVIERGKTGWLGL